MKNHRVTPAHGLPTLTALKGSCYNHCCCNPSWGVVVVVVLVLIPVVVVLKLVLVLILVLVIVLVVVSS